MEMMLGLVVSAAPNDTPYTKHVRGRFAAVFHPSTFDAMKMLLASAGPTAALKLAVPVYSDDGNANPAEAIA
jgi:hypothetical protein